MVSLIFFYILNVRLYQTGKLVITYTITVTTISDETTVYPFDSSFTPLGGINAYFGAMGLNGIVKFTWKASDGYFSVNTLSSPGERKEIYPGDTAYFREKNSGSWSMARGLILERKNQSITL